MILLTTKGALLTGALSLVGLGVFAQAAAAQLPGEIETVWPTSVAGWVGLMLGFSSLVGVIYAVHKSSLKPVQEQITKVEKHFDQKLEEMEEKWVQQFNAYRESLNFQMNGFGTRVARVEEAFVGQAALLNGLMTSMAASTEDRRHMNKKLDEISQQIETMTHNRAAFEARILDILSRRA